MVQFVALGFMQSAIIGTIDEYMKPRVTDSTM